MPIPIDHDNFEPDAELHRWKLHYGMGNPYLTGIIRNQKEERFQDGAFVTTSSVQFIWDDKATTRNTRYLLKDPR